MSDYFCEGMLNVKNFGAAGDGIKDDTASIQAALDAAEKTKNTVVFPVGVYLCHDLIMRPNTGMLGVCNWGYTSLGGSVLKINSTDAKYLIDITEGIGCTINGMSFSGNEKFGENIHAIYASGMNSLKKEDGYRIERCRVEKFSGDGIHFVHAWCFSIRGSAFFGNGKSGIYADGCDGFIIDCWLSANEISGFRSDSWHSSTTFTANRVEWNKVSGMHIAQGNTMNITGNYFDRSSGPAIFASDFQQLTITGNIIHRSGASEKFADTDDDCHVRICKVSGAAMTCNSFSAAKDDGNDKGRLSPSYGVVLDEVEFCVVKDNVWQKGVTKEFLLDRRGNKEGIIVKDNPGCIREE